MNIRGAVLGCLFLTFLLGACSGESNEASGSDGGGGTSSGNPAGVPSCADVCAAIGKQCGQMPPNCSDGCSMLSNEAKACVVNASSCAAIDGCGSSSASSASSSASSASSSSSSASSGSGGSGDVCAACKGDEFCVKSSSIESEVGCVGLPFDCNDSLCVCLIAKGCSQGGKSCAGSIVECL
ncbi:hypothetical protein [Polyangium mundeleinium]|uniref:Lipoprotein n=1 Tax=Polyangium mundeleinium TaxID=2995306 RepID=A0ABT5EQG2_9BACT|nr:hypothetical protein [Polyangium mundeleinium]MDC0743579.1 hypothetical protein [Polyangium mundeleinium]